MKTALTRCLLFFGLLIPAFSSAQIIWSEDFTYADGTTAGPAGKWTSNCPACVPTGDYLEVRSNVFTGVDMNDWAFWQSETINISGCDIEFSLDANEIGDHEGPGCSCGINIDYFDVYYSIDGGPMTVIEDWNGDGDVGHTLTGDSLNSAYTDADWGSTTVIQSGLTGTTLQLRVELRNTAGSETMELDNVTVTCTPLPVELLNFEVQPEGEGVRIDWSTSQESNSSHFLIQRSFNGQTWANIGRVEASGFSDSPIAYGFSDENVRPGSVWYRIRMVDLDGSYKNSEAASLYLADHALEFVNVYPNPVQDQLHIELNAMEPGTAIILITDIAGRLLDQQSLDLQSGLNSLSLNAAEIPTGIYMLRIKSQGHELTRRFVVR